MPPEHETCYSPIHFLMCLRSIFVPAACGLAWALSASAAEPVVYRPLEGAPYAASATVSAYATKVFVSGVVASDGTAALAKIEHALAPLGLSRAGWVNLRAALLPGADGALEMDGWNTAWNAHFAAVPHRPTRTTLGASDLPEAGAVQVEGVAAVAWPEGRSLPARVSPLNPFVHTLGEGAWGSSAAAIVTPGTALIVTAGILADPADLSAPERTVARYGDVATQTRSVLRKLERILAGLGVQWEDVFYVRALLSPPAAGGAVDFAGFGREFAAAFPGRHPALRPALTVWAGPGFSSGGQLVEIELYAAAADGRGPFTLYDPAAANPWLTLTGAPESLISTGAAAARFRPLTWFSGAIGTGGGGIHDEAVTALLALRARYAAAGLQLSDTLHLRAYPVVGDAFRPAFDAWNEAYGRFFHHARLNPHRPARTAFPVPALPRGRLILISAVEKG
jgi:enamine deaminase RidA (YjgF/YER057c/UK114 family)